MIVSDNCNHKVDLEFTSEGWLQISSFHKRSESEWTSKVMRLSPETIRALISYIATYNSLSLYSKHEIQEPLVERE